MFRTRSQRKSALGSVSTLDTEVVNRSAENKAVEDRRNTAVADPVSATVPPTVSYRNGTVVNSPFAEDIGSGLTGVADNDVRSNPYRSLIRRYATTEETEARFCPLPHQIVYALRAVLIAFDFGDHPELTETIDELDHQCHHQAEELQTSNITHDMILATALALCVERPIETGRFTYARFASGSDGAPTDLLITRFAFPNRGQPFSVNTETRLERVGAGVFTDQDLTLRHAQTLSHYLPLVTTSKHTTMRLRPGWTGSMPETFYEAVRSAVADGRDYLLYSVPWDDLADAFHLERSDPDNVRHRNIAIDSALIEDYKVASDVSDTLGEVSVSLAFGDHNGRLVECVRKPFRDEGSVLSHTVEFNGTSVLVPGRRKRATIPSPGPEEIKLDSGTTRQVFHPSRLLYDRHISSLHLLCNIIFAMDLERELDKLFVIDPRDPTLAMIKLPAKGKHSHNLITYLACGMALDLITVAAPDHIMEMAQERFPETYHDVLRPYLTDGGELQNDYFQQMHEFRTSFKQKRHALQRELETMDKSLASRKIGTEKRASLIAEHKKKHEKLVSQIKAMYHVEKNATALDDQFADVTAAADTIMDAAEDEEEKEEVSEEELPAGPKESDDEKSIEAGDIDYGAASDLERIVRTTNDVEDNPHQSASDSERQADESRPEVANELSGEEKGSGDEGKLGEELSGGERKELSGGEISGGEKGSGTELSGGEERELSGGEKDILILSGDEKKELSEEKLQSGDDSDVLSGNKMANEQPSRMAGSDMEVNDPSTFTDDEMMHEEAEQEEDAKYEAMFQEMERQVEGLFVPRWNIQSPEHRQIIAFLVRRTVYDPAIGTAKIPPRVPAVMGADNMPIGTVMHLNYNRARQYVASVLRPFDFSNMMQRLNALTVIIRPNDRRMPDIMRTLEFQRQYDQGNVHLFSKEFDLALKLCVAFRVVKWDGNRNVIQ